MKRADDDEHRRDRRRARCRWPARAAAGSPASSALLAGVPVSPYAQDLVVTIDDLAIFALSLELLVGATGLVSLGHAAFFGIGAYATVLAVAGSRRRLARAGCCRWRSAARPRTRSCVGALQPAHARRLLHHGDAGVRADGVLRVPRHQARRRQRRHLPVRQAGARDRRVDLLDLGQRAHVLLLDARRAGRSPTRFLALLLRSRFGHALAGIRVNEQRMRAAGFSTYAATSSPPSSLAGALAGLAGFLFAVKDGCVNPELLAWHESGAVLLMLILGGIGTPARRGARRVRVHAAEGAVPVRGAVRPARASTGS